MQRVLRPYITAGVALAGASMIAVTPAAPPLPTIQMPAVQLTSATDSLDLGSLLNLGDTTTAFPVITPTEFFSDTLQNLQAVGAAIAADPTPILTQIIANLTGYGQDISTGLQSAGAALESLLQGLPAELQTALGLLESGDLFDALTGLNSYLTGGLVINVGLPLVGGLSQVIQGITTNISNLGQDAEQVLAFSALALLPGPNAVFTAVAGLGQNLVNGVSTGNLGEILTTLLNGPTTLLSSFFNGYDDVSCPDCTIDPTAGLLTGVPGSTQPSAGDGTAGIILMLQQTIAQALGASAADPSAAASHDSLAGLLDVVLSGQSSGLSTLGSDLAALLSGSGLSDLSGLSTDLSQLSTDLLNLF